jgi:hypothetical protein
MKWTSFCALVVCGSAVLFNAYLPNRCLSQNIPDPELLERLNGTPEYLFQAFDEWNDQRPVEKVTFSEIVESDIARIGRDRQPTWEAPRFVLWRELPQILKPELRASPGARFVLLGLFQENIEAFQRTIDGREAQALHARAKVYFTLSVAQAVARSRRSQAIEGSHVLLAVQQGSYSFWPFYCPPPDTNE